ncbi:hypothetical protein ACFV16_33285 [Streptomyces massasporeus]|uniref:hypothetical protein n=1 Tax=Streptomyces massasporeus TaxID=67324 RepID=UPI003686B362
MWEPPVRVRVDAPVTPPPPAPVPVRPRRRQPGTTSPRTKHAVPLFLDAARFAENAWLVTQHEAAHRDMSPRQVAGQAFRMADGWTASSTAAASSACETVPWPSGANCCLLPHIAAHRFPGHALACRLYLEGGSRSVELGSIYLGSEDENGAPVTAAPYELVRLALPRRTYGLGHLN